MAVYLDPGNLYDIYADGDYWGTLEFPNQEACMDPWKCFMSVYKGSNLTFREGFHLLVNGILLFVASPYTKEIRNAMKEAYFKNKHIKEEKVFKANELRRQSSRRYRARKKQMILNS